MTSAILGSAIAPVLVGSRGGPLLERDVFGAVLGEQADVEPKAPEIPIQRAT